MFLCYTSLVNELILRLRIIDLAALSKIAISIGAIFASSIALSQEYIEDPDYDYLPPERPSLFGRMLSGAVDLFVTRSHSTSYEQAKRRLYNNIGDAKAFYCGCNTKLAEREFDKENCGYIPRNDNIRAHRLEAEHVLPAFWIAKFYPGETCWIAADECGSGRDCCLTNNARFRKAHNDLVNLYPAIGELNAERSNLIYDLINGEDRLYGSCDFEVDRAKRISEPRDDIRGDIARIYFYMRDTYELAYPDWLDERLTEWDNADPISVSERTRNMLINAAQGSANPALVE